MNRQLPIFVTLTIVALCGQLLHACNGPYQGKATPTRPPDNTLTHPRIIDSAISLLQTGDVVFRMGIGAQSTLLAHLNRTDRGFSHCGIVVRQRGYPYVYHSIGGEDNPDARLRKDSAHRFFSPRQSTALAIARYPLDTSVVSDIITRYYRNRPKFDLSFSMATDDELYCTEFVYKVLREASGDSSYIPTSELRGTQYVGTDNLYLNDHARLVWRVRFM